MQPERRDLARDPTFGPAGPDYRPLVIAAVTAAVSIGLLALAIAGGWLGPDVGRGATFCEAAREGLVKQPANAWSNLGFVVAGLAIGWRARHPANVGLMGTRLATVMAAVVVLLGPASAAMHATQSEWGGHLDMLSMYLIAAFAAAYGLVRLLRRGTGTFVAAYAAGVLGCEAVGLYSGDVPVVRYAGNLAFGALLVAAVGFETALWRRGETRRTFGYGVGALAAMLVAFVIWILGQHGWCDPHSLLQAHAAWHLLCAVAAYLLFRLYASERPR